MRISFELGAYDVEVIKPCEDDVERPPYSQFFAFTQFWSESVVSVEKYQPRTDSRNLLKISLSEEIEVGLGSTFRPRGCLGNDHIEKESLVRTKVIFIPSDNSSPSNFDKLKRAFEHLRDLGKANDPFDN